VNRYFSSTLFRKTLAALSGLFLTLFLIGHLIGNLQLFIPGEMGQKQFNQYALFMTSNPVVKILSYVTYASILLHVFVTLMLTVKSKSARNIAYAESSGNSNSHWESRNMAILGTFIMIFLIIHLKSFWYEMHFGEIVMDPWGNKDLHSVTMVAFEQLWYVIFYVLSMIVLALHLKHGVESAFQTLGVKTRLYQSTIHKAVYFFSFAIPALFATIPIYIFWKQL